MANVTETSNFDAGIYQLETTDPLEGGSLGVLNYAIKGLANRTKWLKDNSLIFLKKGTVPVGNIITHKVVAVSFSSIGTSNYMVMGSLVSKSADSSFDTGVTWAVRDRTATSFNLLLRESTGLDQNIDFDYTIIPK